MQLMGNSRKAVSANSTTKEEDKNMTKDKMLQEILNESSYKACRYYMDLRKPVIEEAYRKYNEVSHKQGREHLRKSYMDRSNRIR